MNHPGSLSTAQFATDLRRAGRTLRHAPGFAVVVVGTIAVGIAANVSALSIIDTAFFRPLPVSEPERIVRVECRDSTYAHRHDLTACSFPEWNDLQQRVKGLEGLAAYAMDELPLGKELAGRSAYAAFVTGNYFSVLGVRASRGRAIQVDDAAEGAPHAVAVISDALWRDGFGSDPAVVGRWITIRNSPFLVIGVAPPRFSGVHVEGRTDLWLPYTSKELATGRNDFASRGARVIWTPLIGRLARGSSVAQVQASLVNAARELSAAFPESNAHTIYRAQLRRTFVGIDQAVSAFAAFLIAWLMVALVHVVACSNVAGLVLARALSRRRELGIRLCLGASRGHIVMHALSEPIVLTMFGAVGGLVLSRWITDVLTRMWFLSALDAGLNARLVVLVALISVGTALLFGIMPALVATRREPLEMLRPAMFGPPARARDVTRSILVWQVALSLILAGQSLLLIGKYRSEMTVALGFEERALLFAQVRLDHEHATPAEWSALYEAAVARALAVPGVGHVSAVDRTPLRFNAWYEEVDVTGHDYRADESPQAWLSAVGPEYFATIGARLLAGREFRSTDRYVPGQKRLGAFDVAIVNESFAHRFWPNDNPVGKTLTFRRSTATVVGVVNDMRDVVLSRATQRVYFPLLEQSYTSFALAVRVSGDASSAAGRVRAALSSLPQTEPPRTLTIEEIRSDQLRVPRAIGTVLVIGAGVALLLTAIGLYAMVAMWAASRRLEIGIRLALGAGPGHVYRLLLSRPGLLAGLGAIIGGFLFTGIVALERWQFGPSLRIEASSLSVTVAAFMVVILVASVVPARHATKTSPAAVMKDAPA